MMHFVHSPNAPFICSCFGSSAKSKNLFSFKLFGKSIHQFCSSYSRIKGFLMINSQMHWQRFLISCVYPKGRKKDAIRDNSDSFTAVWLIEDYRSSCAGKNFLRASHEDGDCVFLSRQTYSLNKTLANLKDFSRAADTSVLLTAET